MASVMLYSPAPGAGEGDTLSSMNVLIRLDIDALPQTIVWDQPVTDAFLEDLCAANDLLTIERTKEGRLNVNPPTGLFTGDANSEIIHQLRVWWKTHRNGRVTDSDTGFYLNDGSMLNPDAAYINADRLSAVSAEDRGFPHVCPNFVIELLSKSDSLKATRRKMRDWVANGVEIGWLIEPYKRKVEVHDPDGSVTIGSDSIDGHGPVEGFTLDLAEVWRCYE